ncbi:hypothetical protein D3C71_1319170 [compost metagenome]
MIEPSGHFAGEFDMRQLIGANRHHPGPVQQDIRRLQQWITQKAIGGEFSPRQPVLLFLVGRYPLQPAERADHRQQQMQLGVLRHLRLDKQGRGTGADPGRQPIHRHVHDMLGDLPDILVVDRQCVPVDDAEKAFVFVLQLDPAFQHAMIMAKVQTATGTHAGQHAAFGINKAQTGLPKRIDKA